MKSFEINRLEPDWCSPRLPWLFRACTACRCTDAARGYKTGIITGLCLYGVGCFLFWPAAIVGQYWFFLTALFVIAAGLSFLRLRRVVHCSDGSFRTSEQRLNLAQAFILWKHPAVLLAADSSSPVLS